MGEQKGKTKSLDEKVASSRKSNEQTEAMNAKVSKSDNKVKDGSVASKLPLNKWWFWVVILIILSTILSAISNIGKKNESKKIEINQEYTELKEVDVNGMTIAEACAAVREVGWRVSEVHNDNNYSEQSDCSNTQYKATRGSYNKEKYSSYSGSISDSYETVVIFYAGPQKEGKNETKKEESGVEEKKEDSVSTSSDSSSSATPTQSSASVSGYQGIYDTYAARLRNECPTLSTSECAELLNDGVGEMADYMWKAHGTDGQYETYSDWSGKLWDVYMESAR